MRWTASERDTAIDLWNKGFSASEIGERIDRTPNSVIGRIDRMHKDGLSPLRSIDQRPFKATSPRKVRATVDASSAALDGKTFT